MDSEKQKPVLSVRVEPDLLRRVDELTELAGVTRAEIVERCLSLGLANQEELVEWIKAPVKGPLVQLLTHPAILNAMGKLFNEVADDTTQKLRAGAVSKRKGLQAKPAANK